MQSHSREIIEIILTPFHCRDELIARLHELGYHDYIEGSCDHLDADWGDELQWIEAFEAGELQLPLLLYSYDQKAVADLLATLSQQFHSRLNMRTRHIADSIWQTAWEPEFEYLETDQFLIASPQIAETRDGKHHILMESGSVFGSGQHATTQAMVRLMEQLCPAVAVEPQANFLDVGTGTGVLTFVARKLGFQHLIATDIEPEALEIARRNQLLNGITFPLIEGSLPAAEDLFTVIACNILPPTLTHLLPELQKLLKPNGLLLLAGFHQANAVDILTAGRQIGLVERARVEERGWIALALDLE